MVNMNCTDPEERYPPSELVNDFRRLDADHFGRLSQRKAMKGRRAHVAVEEKGAMLYSQT